MYSRLKTFLRQELDVLFAVNFFALISFHFNLFRCNRKIRTRLKARSKPYNSDLTAQEKYLNYKFWLKESLIRFYKLGLHREEKKTILDIGTGTGYFPFICNEFSHAGFCLDVPDKELYDQITDSLGLIKFKRYIKSFELLKLNTNERFDLVTAYMICFNNHKQENLWSNKEWEFFISDLQDNYLKKDGKIFLNFNEESPGIYFSSELLGYFKGMNYVVEGNNILIENRTT